MIYIKVPSYFSKLYGLYLQGQDWYVVVNPENSDLYKWYNPDKKLDYYTGWLPLSSHKPEVVRWIKAGHKPLFRLIE